MMPARASLISHSRDVHRTFPTRLDGLSAGTGWRRMRDGRAGCCSSTLFLPGFRCLITRPPYPPYGFDPVSCPWPVASPAWYTPSRGRVVEGEATCESLYLDWQRQLPPSHSLLP